MNIDERAARKQSGGRLGAIACIVGLVGVGLAILPLAMTWDFVVLGVAIGIALVVISNLALG